ncbi:hypothetical protein O7627_20335 [Solwaraspora sp. WMMD1047]|uniref:hypothetical protein n=1 Tax=Solwaraspora sp. WMMD1047 TaxID=3016102 RepID=UPI00241803E4|nr:hypothetical protein [Solwaraspora sp. WMMD1047]MDG4831632.1 hypothetical protein [Solwaraspora sp. WMMD1047]
MGPESPLGIELGPDEALADTVKTIVLPWSGQSVNIRIPAGTADGTVLRLPQLGPAAADGSRQDAYVQVRVGATPGPAPTAGPNPVEAAGSGQAESGLPQYSLPPESGATQFAPPQSGPPSQSGPPQFAPPQFAPPQSGPPAPPGSPQFAPPQSGPPAPPGSPQFGPPQFGPAQFPVAVPPPGPASPWRRKRFIAAGAALAVLLLAGCCAVPVMFFRDDPATEATGDPSSSPSAAAPRPSATPVGPDEYQALLTAADTELTKEFQTLTAAKNPNVIEVAALDVRAGIDKHYRALVAVTPPPAIATAHTQLLTSLAGLREALTDAGRAADSGDICLGPSALSRVGRSEAAGAVREAAQALATADPTRAYRVGSFVPKNAGDGSRRLANGTYVKRTQGGSGQLKIENGGGDAVISIVKGSAKSPVIRVYVRSKNSFTVTGITDGTYRIFMTNGRDWNPGLRAFSLECRYRKFDDSFKFTTTSRTFTIWTIKLTPQLGGNASTSGVDPDEFPGG